MVPRWGNAESAPLDPGRIQGLPRTTQAAMAKTSGSRGGGISESVLLTVGQRLQDHVRQNWPGCKAVEVRKRGQFLYVDAQAAEDLELAPLCRLRYLGAVDSWEFAYFTWSREAYEPSFLANGSPFGTPEECFDASAFGMFGQ